LVSRYSSITYLDGGDREEAAGQSANAACRNHPFGSLRVGA
jgi:hypothetical protein